MKLLTLCKSKEVYLDNSATSRFKPLTSTVSLAFANMRSANPGRSGHKDSLNIALAIEQCRLNITNLLGEGNVVFTKNCTEALNLAIIGSKLNGNVVTSMLEHNSILRPLYHLSNQNKVSLKILKPNSNGIITPESIANAIDSKTSLVAISECSNTIGVRQPIEKIAEVTSLANVKLLLDCAQSLGHFTTNYSKVDMIATSGHKGLHGPMGTGFLWCKNNINLAPILLGGTGTDSTSAVQPNSFPEGYEAGTSNASAIIALDKALTWTIAHLNKINSHSDALLKALICGLNDIRGVKVYNLAESPCGVVLFNIGNMQSTEVADILDKEFNIAVRSGMHCAPLAHNFLNTAKQGGIRASIGYCNTLSDINRLIKAVTIIANKTGL